MIERPLTSEEIDELNRLLAALTPASLPRAKRLWERSILYGCETTEPRAFTGLLPRMNE